MRKHFAIVAVLLLVCCASDALARGRIHHLNQARLPGDAIDDRPPNLTPLSEQASARCTLSFGYVDEDGFAILDDIWNFDHGDADPFEGWTFVDMTEQPRSFWRHITSDAWVNGDTDNGNVPTENTVDVPLLTGQGTVWLGAFQNEADGLCWAGGLGYGNRWFQELRGPELQYDGSSTITVDFDYFNDTEEGFDYTYVVLQTLPSGTETELLRLGGQDGLAPDHPNSPPVGTSFSGDFADFGTDTHFRLLFKMTSDGGWSDEDGQFTTEYGGFAVDNIALGNTGADGTVDELYDFEESLMGWTPTLGPAIGSFASIRDVSNYDIEDPCGCELAGNVLARHDEDFGHPDGQQVQAVSNPVDVTNDVVGVCGSLGQLEIFADWAQYSSQPRANGVFYRPGWNYYPAICEITGETGWSGRVGQSTYFSTGDDAICFRSRNVATDHGIPSDIEQIRFIHEIYASCDAFGIGEEECTESTNFTPLIDNIRIRFTVVPDAPPLSYDPGDRYTDGFSQGSLLDPNVPGNANTVINVNFGNDNPMINGDSLRVIGPISSPGLEYDARLWFRVARKGPGSNSAGYDAWRAMVQTDGGIDAGIDGTVDIEAGEFATAKMDSAQIGHNPSSAIFLSYFIEEDARYALNGTAELTEGQEIIRDGVLLPGTSIEYFVTGNYINSSPVQFSLLPDTSGGFFSEFEILPSWRDDGGILKYPCLLYIDAYNGGAQYYIESALDALGIEADRYDYLDASSSWKAPMARGLTSDANNGCTVLQLLGYRGILINTGRLSGGVMWPEDYIMFSDYLTAIACDANTWRQGLILNGDNTASSLRRLAPAFLNGQLGARFLARTYSEEGGSPDQSYCVRIEAPSVGSFSYGTSNSTDDYEYDAFGNWCPQSYHFDVLGTIGSGVGNRAFVNVESGEETSFAQVVNESSFGADTYRTVLDGVSWHHLSDRDPVEECVGDSAHIVTAAMNEISAALEWIFGIGTIPTLCEDPCSTQTVSVPDTEVGADARVTRLFQNSPNPFNPYTTLRFSLATGGPVELIIYDVNGRKVKTLVSDKLEAGSHEIVWDGTNDEGTQLSSGVYWSQFDALGQKSNKKMVLLSR